ncbi:Protein of unknown function [Bacillus thuringiensis]
MNFM